MLPRIYCEIIIVDVDCCCGCSLSFFLFVSVALECKHRVCQIMLTFVSGIAFLCFSRETTRICICLSYCTLQINHAIKNCTWSNYFGWCLRAWSFQGSTKSKCISNYWCIKYVLFYMYSIVRTSRISLKVINVIKENISLI